MKFAITYYERKLAWRLQLNKEMTKFKRVNLTNEKSQRIIVLLQ